jgi:ribosomal protein S18 acetylase RimI-like enzyme
VTGPRVRPLQEDEEGWLRGVLRERWGEDLYVGRGLVRHVDDDDLLALVALDGEERVGVATYVLDGEVARLITIDTLREGSGAGGALIEGVARAARALGAKRLVTWTTNDNLRALRFYQRQGFRLVELRAGAIEEARRLVPSIPEVGHDQIPIRDELHLERDA